MVTSDCRTAESGAVRDVRDGKGRFDLLPFDAFRRVALVLEDGARHYGDRNWEKGMPNSWFIDSGTRHLSQFINGEWDEDHLAKACWNLLCALSQQERIEKGTLSPEYDDIGVRVTPGTRSKKPIELSHPIKSTKIPDACESYGESCKSSPCPDCYLMLYKSLRDVPTPVLCGCSFDG